MLASTHTRPRTTITLDSLGEIDDDAFLSSVESEYRAGQTHVHIVDDEPFLYTGQSGFMAQMTSIDDSEDVTEPTTTSEEPAFPTQAGVCLPSLSPTNLHEADIHTQLFICNQKNWEGNCVYRVEKFGLCVKLDEPW